MSQFLINQITLSTHGKVQTSWFIDEALTIRIPSTYLRKHNAIKLIYNKINEGTVVDVENTLRKLNRIFGIGTRCGKIFYSLRVLWDSRHVFHQSKYRYFENFIAQKLSYRRARYDVLNYCGKAEFHGWVLVVFWTSVGPRSLCHLWQVMLLLQNTPSSRHHKLLVCVFQTHWYLDKHCICAPRYRNTFLHAYSGVTVGRAHNFSNRCKIASCAFSQKL